MADQVETAQSPEDRLMALMGDGNELDIIPSTDDDEPPEVEVATESEGETTEGDETEGDSQEDSPEDEGTLTLTHNGKDVEVPIAEAKALRFATMPPTEIPPNPTP